jgi:ketosteroid isomerase-like protein
MLEAFSLIYKTIYQMKNNHYLSMTATAITLCLFSISCNTPTTDADAKQTIAKVADAVTNPLFSIAPVEYAGLAEKSLMLLSGLDFDAWASTLADDVTYSFPDGDQNTRTTLVGKKAIVDWYKNFKTVAGLQSMTMSEFNSMPIDVTGDAKGGATKGIYVISYFSNTMVFKNATLPLRMNFSLHFNGDKKVDRYTSYYDRTPIIKAIGMNLLEKKKEK